MKTLLKNRKQIVLLILLIIFLINSYLFYSEFQLNTQLKTQFNKTDLFVKSVKNDDLPLAVKMKFSFNPVEKVYFIVDHKQIYAYRRAVYNRIGGINRYSKMEKVFYNKQNPNDFYYESERINYSWKYSFFMKLILGTTFETIVVYLLLFNVLFDKKNQKIMK